MRNVTPNGPYKDIVSVPSPLDRDGWIRPTQFVNYGVSVETFGRMVQLGLSTAIAQYYGIVQEGFAFADRMHLFRGLERPLFLNGNMRADEEMVVYSWKPNADWFWNRVTEMPESRTPAPGRVFKVVAHPHKNADEHGGQGNILHWAWDEEDAELVAAPIEWKERFADKLWSKRRWQMSSL